ncbi:MAG TPA: rhodanese-like domain-containing protein [Salegentibacter sp.]|uniref:rhodanese-like domain-containing protein n=1 Tax=Salegentibacter sp. TaxID=1903072 RepID=UPI002F959521
MVKKKLAKTSSFRYVIFTLFLIVIAGGLIFWYKAPEPEQEGIKVEQLLNDAISSERYISTDQVAQKIIGEDPSFILIDVRSADNYETYSLPNAINIPIQNLLDEEYVGYLNQSQYDVIFYSNDNFYADQAWLLCKRLGYKNLRVLEGGMNRWFTTIINPTVPDENMAAEDFELYSTRKAASMYFGVVYPEPITVEEPIVKKTVPKKPAPKKVIPVKKKKKRPVEGGC